MARLLAVIAIFIAFALIIAALFGGGQRGRGENTWRPRSGWRDLFGLNRPGDGEQGLTHIVHRRELEGVRDAYSSAAVDTSEPLYRCAGCQSFFSEASVRELAARNHHRCAVCGGTDIGIVQVTD